MTTAGRTIHMCGNDHRYRHIKRLADLQADVVGAVPIPSDAAGNSLMQKATRGVKQRLQGIRMQRQNVRPLLCQLT
ncbi:hypothetical protein Tco_0487626, partial [Tanacetum coccineum]